MALIDSECKTEIKVVEYRSDICCIGLTESVLPEQRSNHMIHSAEKTSMNPCPNTRNTAVIGVSRRKLSEKSQKRVIGILRNCEINRLSCCRNVAFLPYILSWNSLFFPTNWLLKSPLRIIRSLIFIMRDINFNIWNKSRSHNVTNWETKKITQIK